MQNLGYERRELQVDPLLPPWILAVKHSYHSFACCRQVPATWSNWKTHTHLGTSIPKVLGPYRGMKMDFILRVLILDSSFRIISGCDFVQNILANTKYNMFQMQKRHVLSHVHPNTKTRERVCVAGGSWMGRASILRTSQRMKTMQRDTLAGQSCGTSLWDTASCLNTLSSVEAWHTLLGFRYSFVGRSWQVLVNLGILTSLKRTLWRITFET